MNEAELVLTHVLNCDRLSLYLDQGMDLSKDKAALISAVLKRRAQGEPVQYILGATEFMGLEFKVDKRVLIPRPETEILVETAIKVVKTAGIQSPKILDLGTGSGCIAVSLAKNIPHGKISAIDVSPEALEVARQNADLHQVQITFMQSDLFTFLGPNNFDGSTSLTIKPEQTPGFGSTSLTIKPEQTPGLGSTSLTILSEDAEAAESKDSPGCVEGFDLIISNPPYVSTPELSVLAKEISFEPALALEGGQDGLDFYRRISNQAAGYLGKGGFLILEMGFGQRKSIENILINSKNFEILEIIKDYNNIERVIVARNRWIS